MDSSTEQLRGQIESAIETLTNNSHLLRLADYWQVFWRGMPAQKSWTALSVVFALLATVATGSWTLSRYILPAEARKIWLHGKVESNEGKPLDKFKIAIVEEQHGPFPNTKDGSFRILVPRKEKYSILVWPPEGFYPSQFWGDVPATESGDTFQLGTTLSGFPVNLGIVEGKVLYADQAPVEGYIEIDGTTSKINSDGSFSIKNIRLGKSKIRVRKKEDINAPILLEEEFDVQVSGPTPKNVNVLRQKGSR